MSLRNKDFGLFSNAAGGGGGGGTVTCVAAVGCCGITVSGSPITGAGTLIISGEAAGIMVLGTGICSTIRCGVCNTANCTYSAALSGFTNSANGSFSVISGGRQNSIGTGLGQDSISTISGGYSNTISAYRNCSFIGGGILNSISGGILNTIVGGATNTVSNGNFGFIGGGCGNTITGFEHEFIGGGIGNTIANTVSCYYQSAIVGGKLNFIANSLQSFIGAGLCNCVNCSSSSLISGGILNIIQVNETSAIISGRTNTISNSYFNICACYNVIGAGCANSIDGVTEAVCYSSIMNGNLNSLGSFNKGAGIFNTIINGFSNCITAGSTGSSILSGCNNVICAIDASITAGNALTNTCTGSTMSCFFTSTNLVGGGDVCADAAGTLQLVVSDIKCKTNIAPLDYGLCQVLQLKPVSYDWCEDRKELHGAGRQIGFIAQEVKCVMPEAVGQNKEGAFSLDMNKIVPSLTKAVQELNESVQGLSIYNQKKELQFNEEVDNLKLVDNNLKVSIQELNEGLSIKFNQEVDSLRGLVEEKSSQVDNNLKVSIQELNESIAHSKDSIQEKLNQLDIAVDFSSTDISNLKNSVSSLNEEIHLLSNLSSDIPNIVKSIEVLTTKVEEISKRKWFW